MEEVVGLSGTARRAIRVGEGDVRPCHLHQSPGWTQRERVGEQRTEPCSSYDELSSPDHITALAQRVGL